VALGVVIAVVLFIVLIVALAHGEPLNTLTEPFGHCDQLVRSFGCKPIWPREAFDPSFKETRERGSDVR